MPPQSCRLQVEEFCYITDNTYTREQVRLASNAERVPAPLGPLCLSWCRRLEPCRAALVAPKAAQPIHQTHRALPLPQVLEMERELLRVLDFDLTQPTIKTFLRRYIKAASGAPPLGGQGGPCACTSPPPASSDSWHHPFPAPPSQRLPAHPGSPLPTVLPPHPCAQARSRWT